MYNTPILLITFNRPEHTRRTLEALLVQSPQYLYVFQDGPRMNNDKDFVACSEVRNIIEHYKQQYTRCNFIAHYSEKNRGCRDAIIFAISSVLKEHEAVIVIEDDIITSRAFLSYMNNALEYYKDRKSVFSISGHSHSPQEFQVPKDYPYDVYCSPRLFNWGWATWRDRWEQVDWTMSYYDELTKHPYELEAFQRSGDDMFPMLRDEREGRSSAWDIQFAFAHFMNHAVSIVPCISYTHNIGEDGSGTHCSAKDSNDVFDLNVLNKNSNPRLIDNLYFDKRIINLQYNVFCRTKRPLWQKVCNWIARELGKPVPFSIKKKIYA